jgi:hypothetical protein
MYKYIYIYINTHIHTYTHTYTDMYIYVYILLIFGDRAGGAIKLVSGEDIECLDLKLLKTKMKRATAYRPS